MNGEPLKVLHVEDNPDHVNLVLRALRKHRLANKVTVLEDGEAALDYLVCEHEKRAGPKIKFGHDLAIDSLPPPLKTAVFRIVQETLNNAERHSRSDRVQVKLSLERNGVRIEVRDWGVGFDPESIRENRHGLQGIRERARVLTGSVAIDTTAGKGTRVDRVAHFAILLR